jgi:hypothetical protein
MVPDSSKNSRSRRTTMGPDSCASPTGASALVPPIIGNHGASAAQEIPPVPNPLGATSHPSMRPRERWAPLRPSEPMTQL